MHCLCYLQNCNDDDFGEVANVMMHWFIHPQTIVCISDIVSLAINMAFPFHLKHMCNLLNGGLSGHLVHKAKYLHIALNAT